MDSKLLNKDSNFYPAPGKYNKISFNNDIQHIISRIKLKWQVKTAKLLRKNDGNLFIKNSSYDQWTLKETHHTVETLTKASFKNELLKETHIKKLPKINLTKTETLNVLSLKDDIIIIIIIIVIIIIITITKAEKDSAVVIVDVEDYINEANRQLKNIDFRKEIPNNPNETKRKKANNTISNLESARLLDERITKN